MIVAACAAIGIGQAAEAATYDVVFTLTSVAHDYCPFMQGYCETSFLDEWWGTAVNTPVQGILEIESNAVAALIINGRIFFGEDGIFQWQSAANSWAEGQGGIWYSYLTWTGTEGTWSHTADHLPDYYLADAEFRLAPVPLPATAALLPLGLGALALMRRRRRRVS